MLNRPTAKNVLKYARAAVRDEAASPRSGRDYDRQAVEFDILNRFEGLTNSDEDYEFIVEQIRTAEAEYNEKHDCDL